MVKARLIAIATWIKVGLSQAMWVEMGLHMSPGYRCDFSQATLSPANLSRRVVDMVQRDAILFLKTEVPLGNLRQ